MAYLEQVKTFGERLIAAVNDDAAVAWRKEPMSPINTLKNRMVLLAGLRVVDWVTALGTPLQSA